MGPTGSDFSSNYRRGDRGSRAKMIGKRSAICPVLAFACGCLQVRTRFGWTYSTRGPERWRRPARRLPPKPAGSLLDLPPPPRRHSLRHRSRLRRLRHRLPLALRRQRIRRRRRRRGRGAFRGAQDVGSACGCV